MYFPSIATCHSGHDIFFYLNLVQLLIKNTNISIDKNKQKTVLFTIRSQNLDYIKRCVESCHQYLVKVCAVLKLPSDLCVNKTISKMNKDNFGVALIQMTVHDNKDENVATAVRLIKEAVQKHKPHLVVLPECFFTPHGKRDYFEKYAETIPNGDVCKTMSNLAKELSIYLIAGTMPEKDGNVYYNTTVVFGNDGKMLTKYRQMHLTKMNVPNKCMLNENDYMKFGKSLCYFDMHGVKIGLGICKDLHFSEMATLYRKFGCHLLVYTITHPPFLGQHNVEILTRARAMDNQLYVVNVAPAYNAANTATEFFNSGHSMFVDPCGTIIKRADDKDEIVFHTLDFNEMDKIRQQNCIYETKRTDVYDTVYKQ